MAIEDNTSQAVILIVDDQISNLDVISIHLRETNYEVLTATSGMEALEIAKTEQPDAILLDILIPQMNGFETCEAIRADKEISDIPLIIMTVLTDMMDIMRGFDVGASDYITKPIHAAELHARLGVHVQNRQSTKKLKAQKANLEIALEQTQSEQKQRLELALNVSKTGIWERDFINNTLIWSPQIYKMFGVEKDNFEVNRQSFLAAIHPHDREIVATALRKAIDDPNEIYQIEHRVVWSDGTIRWVEEKGDVFYDEKGEVIKILGTVVDITARKQAELELLETQGRFSTMVNTALDGILINKDYHIFYANPAIAEILGTTVDDLQGTYYPNHVAPSYRELIMERSQGRIQGKDVPSRYELQFLHSAGHAIDVEISVSTIQQEGQVAIVSFIRDISERKRSETAFRESQERLQAQTNSLMIINRIANILHQSLNFQEVAEQAVETIIQHMGVASAIYKLDDKGEKLNLLHAKGFSKDYRAAISTLSVENTLNGQAIRDKQIIIADDNLNDERIPLYIREALKLYNHEQVILIPLIHNEKALGTLSISYKEKWHVSETDYATFQAIGNAIGIALANAQSLEWLQGEIIERENAVNALQHSEEIARAFQDKLRQLHEISFELSQIESIDDIYRRAIELGREKLGYDRIGFYSIDISENHISGHFSANTQGSISDQRDVRYKITDIPEFANFLSQENRVQLWENTDLYYERKVVGHGWRGIASLHDGKQHVGIIGIDNLLKQQAQRPFEEELLMLYGAVLGYLITSKQHDITKQGLIDRLQVLNGIEQAILMALSPLAIAETVVEHIGNLTGCEYINILNVNFETEQLEVLARSKGYDLPNIIPLSRMPDGYIDTLKQGQPLIENNLQDKFTYVANERGLLDIGILSYTILPMLLDDKLVSILVLGSKRIGSLGEDTVEIAWEIATQLSIAIRQARLHEQVQAHATNLEALVAERTQQLEDKANELEAFTYSVSHDLRSPLRAMHGFSEVLLEDFAEELPEDAQFYLNRIRHNATRLGNLIDDLLTLSRIGRREINKRNVEPKKIIEEILDELDDSEQIGNTKITIKDLPTCEADSTLLRQVWFNLITNAIKYSQKEAQAEIIIDAYYDEEGHLIYRIKDNGVGFDMQYADKLFGVFQRLHSPDEFEGTGIGLATVYRIIDRHGGRVWADSKVGEGSIFYLRFS